MKLEIHNGIGSPPITIEATRVVIFDDLGNPIAFALSLFRDPINKREHIRVSDVGDDDFNHQLKMNGIKDTVIIEKLKI